MGKAGAPKKEWMTEDEVITFLNYHITRKQKIVEIDDEIRSYIELELEGIEVFLFFYCFAIKKWLKEENHPLFEKVNNLTMTGVISWYLGLVEEEENEEDYYDRTLWIKDFDLHENICDTIESELGIMVTLKTHYNFLSSYLTSKGIENNIKDYHLSLAGEGFNEVIKHIRIEKRPIFTPSMTEDMKRKLCKSNFGCCFDIGECFKFVQDGMQPMVVVENVSHFAYLMHELEKRGLVYNNWQSIIEKYNLARYKYKYKKYCTRTTLKASLRQVIDEYATSENSEVAKKYQEIRDFVKDLQTNI